ncbi:hypothetical protein BUALT_Bualt09G0072800 [Buddleja alternifolia]|uniref:Cell number regulator 8-like n=1 Tax=Buddleja alternifolia TaxID=168488 RepID=A0AAV6X1W8_9LAMI|nr:hypothetical protein BUALT_Bualt09G0072800 [Buddleja alternifolia]
MANFEESNPLLPKQEQKPVTNDEKKSFTTTVKGGGAPPIAAVPVGWTADGLPVGLLGSVAPCVLYGTNVERLGSAPGTFANHCLPYSGLYLIGNALFGSNCLAPWFSYPIRTAIRRKFNLEGSCEALVRSCGCCGSFVEDEIQREQCETACDFATHIFCHACALCQEGREVRRRLPHPGFNAQQVLVMIPPGGQAMAHGA